MIKYFLQPRSHISILCRKYIYERISIGTSLRPPIANTNQVPGPGKYLVEPKPIDGPKYSLRPKNERHKVNLNPGPGQYAI
jgi:hypothetical protein